MKVAVISDMHYEFWLNQKPDSRLAKDFRLDVFPEVERDLMILAGDIHFAAKMRDVLKAFSDVSPVLYIPGNHDYYGKSFAEVNALLESMRNGLGPVNPVWMGPKVNFTLKNINFIGATLWTNFDNNEAKGVEAQNCIYDFIAIKPAQGTKLMGYEMRSWFDDHYKHIADGLRAANEAGTKSVVVTHFVPTRNFIHERFKNGKANEYFNNNLNQFIIDNKPSYWVCGHTHDHFVGKVGDTTIVCNPKGYPSEWNVRNNDEDGTYKPYVIEL